MNFQSTILSRFDLIFVLKDVHDRSRDEKIARHVLQVHMHKNMADAETLDIDLAKMKGYINFCKRYTLLKNCKCAPANFRASASQSLLAALEP